MIKEEWTSAKYQGVDSKGKYLVSNLGRVLRFKYGQYEFICTTKRRQSFYFGIDKIKKSVPLARVMLCSFLDVMFSKGEVADHINNDHTDDRLCNLQKLTTSENLRKDIKVNVNPSRYISEVLNSKKYNWSVALPVSCRYRSIYIGMFETKTQATDGRDLIESIILCSVALEWSELYSKVIVSLKKYRDSINLPMIRLNTIRY